MTLKEFAKGIAYANTRMSHLVRCYGKGVPYHKVERRVGVWNLLSNLHMKWELRRFFWVCLEDGEDLSPPEVLEKSKEWEREFFEWATPHAPENVQMLGRSYKKRQKPRGSSLCDLEG